MQCPVCQESLPRSSAADRLSECRVPDQLIPEFNVIAFCCRCCVRSSRPLVDVTAASAGAAGPCCSSAVGVGGVSPVAVELDGAGGSARHQLALRNRGYGVSGLLP